MDSQELSSLDFQISESALEALMKERRNQDRILAFCQVYDLIHNFVGVSFDLTESGICLSLPNTWPETESFSVVLKRADDGSLPEVTVVIEPVWRRERNDYFDEIGGKIISVDSPEIFQGFLDYCQSTGPSGLIEES